MSGLSHRYGDTPVLHDVNLSVKPGEFVVLLGPSGCGKTTLLRSVAGLVNPTGGTIHSDGRLTNENGAERIATEHRGVGLVFQEYALFPHMRVAENVGYGLHPPSKARVHGLLELVGLGELADRYPASLSGGQQQRVALARALAPRPSRSCSMNLSQTSMRLSEILGRPASKSGQGTRSQRVDGDPRPRSRPIDGGPCRVLEPTAQGGVVVHDAVPMTVYQKPQTRTVATPTGPCTFVDVLGQGETADSPWALRLMESHQGPATVVLRQNNSSLL